MSSILKALKRLEEEKSSQGEEKPLNISRDILKSEPRAGINARWLWYLALSATAVILILSSALYRVSANKETPSASRLQAAAVTTPAPAANSAAPLSPLPVASKPGLKAVAAPQTAGARQKATAAPGLPGAGSIQRSAPPKGAASTAEPPKADPDTKTAATPHRPARKEPALTLSGIAWNKDSADRLAIINGQPIATGAVVSGFLVKEIQQDKVILSNDGQVFDLFIGRNARPEQGNIP
jgi:general secretion pathway protein B